MEESMIIEAREVRKCFANHIALNNLSLKVPKGSVFGLLGPNGAGKTSLIRIINQITAPDSGEILIEGTPLKREHIKDIGYLPEERGLYKKMKVGEQALYFAMLKGMNKKEAKSKLLYWFKKFEIENWWNNKIEDLSKGMAQKIQFITTIIHEPKLLILDEPFSGFDPINTDLVKKEILELKEKGTSIILSTHNMNSVEEICDHIALIDKSKTILEGEIESIKQQFTNNSYEVITKNKTLENNDLYDVINSKENTFHIILKEKVNGKEALDYINTNYEVLSFKKESPSMEEIFIKAVGDA